jgi:hypothetical protein
MTTITTNTLLIRKDNRLGWYSLATTAIRKATETLLCSDGSADALTLARWQSEDAKRVILRLASSEVLLPNLEVGKLWGELNDLDDAIEQVAANGERSKDVYIIGIKVELLGNPND